MPSVLVPASSTFLGASGDNVYAALNDHDGDAQDPNVYVDTTISRPTIQTYRGYSIRETSGSAAYVAELYDNTSAGTASKLIDVINVPSGQVVTFNLAEPEGVTTGIYLNVVSGVCKGVIRFG